MTTEKEVGGVFTGIGLDFRRDFGGGTHLSTPNFDFVLERKLAFHQHVKGVPEHDAFGKAVGDHVACVNPPYCTKSVPIKKFPDELNVTQE